MPAFIWNHLFYPFVIESMYLYLLCLSAALLCYTGFRNYSLTQSTSCSCSTCCFGLGFQHQNVQDFIKRYRALIKNICLLLYHMVPTLTVEQNDVNDTRGRRTNETTSR